MELELGKGKWEEMESQWKETNPKTACVEEKIASPQITDEVPGSQQL